MNPKIKTPLDLNYLRAINIQKRVFRKRLKKSLFLKTPQRHHQGSHSAITQHDCGHDTREVNTTL